MACTLFRGPNIPPPHHNSHKNLDANLTNFTAILTLTKIYHNVLNPFINLTSQNLTGLISNLTIIFTLFSFLKVLKGLISLLTAIPQHISHILKCVILISHSNLGANLTSHKRYIGASFNKYIISSKYHIIQIRSDGTLCINISPSPFII